MLSRLSALFLLAALVGWWAEALSEALLLAALTMLAWEGYNLYRFEAWLRKGRQLAPPPPMGSGGTSSTPCTSASSASANVGVICSA